MAREGEQGKLEKLGKGEKKKKQPKIRIGSKKILVFAKYWKNWAKLEGDRKITLVECYAMKSGKTF